MSLSEDLEFTVELWCRESRKARSISIRTQAPYGVEIVVPKGTNNNLIKKIISQNQQYINQKLSEIKNHNFDIKPSKIFFPVTKQHVNVAYRKASFSETNLEISKQTLILNEPTEKESLVNNSRLLQGWLQDKAAIILKDIVRTNSKKLNIPYNKIKVGARKSIWGSCSYKKNINLNRNLIFLEPDLIKYVVTHELCHILEMNHSTKFWSFMNDLLPEYQKLKIRLKSSSSHQIPSWALL
ncbi:M48 family metallopeptidase [Chloroflexi bacterium]|nr:M48 family metallopeptidase [Chloroflexota bacterium]